MQSIEGHLYIDLISIIKKTISNTFKTLTYKINIKIYFDNIVTTFLIKLKN